MQRETSPALTETSSALGNSRDLWPLGSHWDPGACRDVCELWLAPVILHHCSEGPCKFPRGATVGLALGFVVAIPNHLAANYQERVAAV